MKEMRRQNILDAVMKIELLLLSLFSSIIVSLIIIDLQMTVEERTQRVREFCCKNEICEVNFACFRHFETILKMKCGKLASSFSSILDEKCKITRNHEQGKFETSCPYEKLVECP